MLQPVDEAIQSLLKQAITAEQVIHVPVTEACGHVLAEDIVSAIRVPPADNSAMDGYALRLEDAHQSNALPISQRIPAGTPPEPLKAGTAARIFTGAQVPAGADVVIMQENAKVHDSSSTEDSVQFTQLPDSAGANIRRAGEDIETGATILKSGTALRPQETGLLASIGVAQVAVFKPVRVAVLSTGSELAEPGHPLLPGQIYNSNRPMMLSMLNAMGFEAIDAGICKDTLDGTKQALADAAKDVDVIITSGGVSVGDEDHVKAAVEALGELNLWKVAIKPGKPFAFGKIAHQGHSAHFIGLPGNPASVFTTFLILARPFLMACQGKSSTGIVPIGVPAGFSRKAASRQEYLRVRVVDGKLALFPNQGSGVLTSACWGEGFAIHRIGTEITEGEQMDFVPFSALLSAH